MHHNSYHAPGPREYVVPAAAGVTIAGPAQFHDICLSTSLPPCGALFANSFLQPYPAPLQAKLPYTERGEEIMRSPKVAKRNSVLGANCGFTVMGEFSKPHIQLLAYYASSQICGLL